MIKKIFLSLLFTISIMILSIQPAQAQFCTNDAQCTAAGTTCNENDRRCVETCTAQNPSCSQNGTICDTVNGYCVPSANVPPTPLPPAPLPPVPSPEFDVDRGPTNATFDQVNPLMLAESEYADDFRTPGGIISRVLVFAFPIAGVILFVMIIWGGFEMLGGAHEKKSLDSGRQRVTAAIVGFTLLFCAYWLAQIVEFIFGISIL